jgi:hypothetical protein
MEDTLPAWLRRQAERRGSAIALRHKRRGSWRPLTWRQAEGQVRRLAAALAARGFRPGDRLLLLSEHPSPPGVLLGLAAQWLGGAVVPGDGGVFDRPTHAFVDGEAQVRALRRRLPSGTRLAAIIYADGRGLIDDDDPELVAYERLLAAEEIAGAPAAQGGQAAFVFGVEPCVHRELVEVGHRLIETAGLDARHEALVSRGFTSAAHARTIIAPWLMAGFRLNFPETLSTRDQDRRELQPTLVVGTADSYGRLIRRVGQLLPRPGTWWRRLVDWGLRPGGGLLAGAVGHWLVRRPLRAVLGLSRTTVPLLVGPPLDEAPAALLARLGVRPRRWPS